MYFRRVLSTRFSCSGDDMKLTRRSKWFPETAITYTIGSTSESHRCDRAFRRRKLQDTCYRRLLYIEVYHDQRLQNWECLSSIAATSAIH